MNQMANLALEGGDPRDPTHPIETITHGNKPVETELIRAIHDSSVTFEEYMYYGAITRAEEKAANERYVAAAGPKTFKSVVMNRFSKGQTTEAHSLDSPGSPADNSSPGEKNGYDEKAVAPADRNWGNVSDGEWKNASRAVRTAGWTSVFYLITTDILGPFSVP
jgi:hypothetical protein